MKKVILGFMVFIGVNATAQVSKDSIKLGHLQEVTVQGPIKAAATSAPGPTFLIRVANLLINVLLCVNLR